MALKLGKSFDRNYNLRIPFLRGFYDVGIFFSKNSNFLLFSVEPTNQFDSNDFVKINMFKNLVSSKFCETFIKLHNYKNNNLDILNQFDQIKPEYHTNISFILNETIQLAKIQIEDKEEDKVLFDTLSIYGFTLNVYHNEFIFIITERQNIVRGVNKKIVRTAGLQISTTSGIDLLNDYHQESLFLGKEGLIKPILDNTKIIKLK